MNVAEKKEEILGLIERLRAGPKRGQTLRRGPAPPSSEQLSERIATRRQDLLSLRDRREKAGLDLLQERLLGVCRALEERIARIENMIDHSSDDNTAVQLKRGALPGIDLAPELASMMPNLNAGATADVKIGLSGEGRPIPPISAAVREQLYSLSGVLEEDTLPDVLQFVSSSGKSGVFTAEFGSDRVELFFCEGQIVHARGGDLSGQQAFFAAMAFREGRFFFDESAAIPEERSIDGNTQFMILEALRQIDEDRRKA